MPYCDLLHIAGSIRRHKDEVKDIEIVCQPKRIVASLFGGQEEGAPPVAEFIEMLRHIGQPVKGTPYGRYMQLWLPDGIALDLFMPQAVDYYRQLAIRTGSAEYSHKVIAAAWAKKGWVGTKDGLRKKSQCNEVKQGEKTIYIPTGTAEKPPVWTSEEAFFTWLGVPWLKPNERHIP